MESLSFTGCFGLEMLVVSKNELNQQSFEKK